ncbi:carbohydrate ABC transporter permease [Sporolactobacillus spathodeae]|uniref:Raffinose/stachyose/melibiose transport system permease protein n=1 Tax=Sporolactobacillus spathodeae TaxID=1465502 RepID=A0ABS2Q5G3_9BACL|nr:carbohydrate ABC transporter permease [Sporolactobacillus spathodeae]MBM7656670.1 raffinose/stachyose/melibiose transport system permease protein [Sporolactobacillus spathodeae]
MKNKHMSIRMIQVVSFLLGIIWLLPFYLMVVNSLKTKKDIFVNTLGFPNPFSASNYPDAMQQLDFLKSLTNSVLITIVSVSIIIIFSSMAAYALVRTKKKISGIIFLIFASAMLIPFQSVMIPLVSIFGKVHMLNRIGIIFMYLGFGSSLSIFLYHGSLKSIPTALDEAARIDGCNRWQTFWYVIFPMLKPITVTVAILNAIWIWNDYLLPSLVINAPDTQTIPLKMFYFFGEYTKQWNLALAGLTISILPIIIFYFFAQKQIIKGMTEGSVK